MAKNKETALAKTNVPSEAMQKLFNSPAGVNLDKIDRRNMPQLVKPSDVPIGGVVSGEIIKIVNSPVSTIKGKLLWLKHNSGTEFVFPCTGVIRNALAPGLKGDDGDKLQAVLENEIGKTFVAKRLEDKQSTQYKKTMFMFDVYTISN